MCPKWQSPRHVNKWYTIKYNYINLTRNYFSKLEKTFDQSEFSRHIYVH